ncbi:tRNA methyltransferase [Altererythrobacter sp. B11]|uniref:tRNA (cytidine(34)-2'-O)-methyltransferase n=1 Tax=Altererythrobacter sp. B11 TaxID=2060312 RepID=UPI000DC73D91|nr:tRNA (cytidine(34)-2'-O)-methyltransferase [Altererythrobacter sp. B11]BBC74186.1 tRNA methyltransferase [Altererythrobacter sp. B11]
MPLSIVLVQPEIPHNTGAIGRTCVALDLELVLIHPLGFDLSDRQVKRAGLDYWPHVRLAEFASWEAFLAERGPREDQLFLFEEYAERSFYDADYPEDAYLVFGRETKGLPAAVVEPLRHRLVRLPMRSDRIRSLNLANAATAAAYQALRGRLD